MTSAESKASDRVLAGRCRCGAVRYQVSDAFVYAANCHCSECRAATGSAFKAFAGIEREQLTIAEVDRAQLAGHGEAGWHRHTDVRHLGEVRTLAAEDRLHVARPVRASIAEEIDVTSVSRCGGAGHVRRVSEEKAQQP